MHAAISGTIDFREYDEPSCLELCIAWWNACLPILACRVRSAKRPAGEGHRQCLQGAGPREEYDVRDLLALAFGQGSLR